MAKFEVGKRYLFPDIFCGGFEHYHCISRTESEVTFCVTSDIGLAETDGEWGGEIITFPVKEYEDTEYVVVTEYHGERICLYAKKN